MTHLIITLIVVSIGGIDDNLIHAIRMAESGNKISAVGDDDKSIGHMQIQPAIITDVNKYYKTKYTLEDRTNRIKSEEICRKYLEYWGKYYTKKTGKKPTKEIYARLWNGGPQGWNPKYKTKYKNTTHYWEKHVKPFLR